MKKRMMTLLLAAVLLLTLAVPGLAAAESHVIDEAGLMTAKEVQKLEQLAAEISGSYGCGVYLAAIDDFLDYGATPEEAAIAIYEQNGWGLGEGHEGFMLMLSMADRDYWLMSHGVAGNTALQSAGRTMLEDEFLPCFGENEWFDGFKAYLEESKWLLKQASRGEPVTEVVVRRNPLISYGMAFAVSAVIGLLVCMSFKRQMNTAVAQADADAYVTKDGISITHRSDRYTHTTTVREKIREDNDSGSRSSGGGSSNSGGGYSGGGGKF